MQPREIVVEVKDEEGHVHRQVRLAREGRMDPGKVVQMAGASIQALSECQVDLPGLRLHLEINIR